MYKKKYFGASRVRGGIIANKRESINFNKSIFYCAPCAEYIRCRHFDDDGVFFVRDIRVAERVGTSRGVAGLRAAAVSRRVSGVRRKRGLGLWRKG